MRKIYHSILCGTSLCLLTAALSAQTTTILSENWANGSRTNQNLPNSSAWFTSAADSTLTAATGSMTQNNSETAMFLTYFTQSGSPVSLQKGQVLQVSYQFSLSGVPIGNGNFFRFGLFDSGGNRVAADGLGRGAASGGTPVYRGYTGYLIDQTNAASTNPDTGSALVKKRIRNSNYGLMSSTSSGNYTTIGSSTGVLAGYLNNTTYNTVFSIAYNLNDTVTITSSVYGPDQTLLYSLSVIDTASNLYTSFDTIAFTPSGSTATTMTLYSMDITLGQIPEPSTVAAIGAGISLLACLGLRRRQLSKAS